MTFLFLVLVLLVLVLLLFLNKVLTWKIVEASKALVIYIYIDYSKLIFYEGKCLVYVTFFFLM